MTEFGWGWAMLVSSVRATLAYPYTGTRHCGRIGTLEKKELKCLTTVRDIRSLYYYN